MKPTVFLDMDGVCCNFIKRALEIWGRMDLYEEATWLPTMLGMTDATFWARIRPHEPSFWREIEPFPWFDELYKELTARARVVFLTSPARSANSLLGKVQWLQDRFGESFREYIITPRKFYCGHYPKGFLIDDQDKNMDAWQGHGYLFPQPWNRTEARLPEADVVPIVIGAVESWLEEIA